MSLPPCHSRREVEAGSLEFFCAHPNVHARNNLVTAGVCQVCPQWRQPAPPTFRAFRPASLPRQRGRCVHLGEQIGLRDCPTCRGTVRMKVFACGHPDHRETTLSFCRDCPDHQEALVPAAPTA